jgi:Ser/Thr protein kinase RdoA (MazF antagonist)
MAKLHQTTLNQELKRMDYDVNTLIQLPYQYATTHFSETIPEMQFLKYGGDQITAVFKEVDATKLRYGSVHLDLWYDNMNIENEETITIFDFDFCGNGWQALDLAYFNVQLFNTEFDANEYQRKLERFFEGYESITPISNEEKHILPYLAVSIWFFYLGVQCQRFDDWGNLFISEDYFKRFMGMIQKWCAHHQLFT